MNAREDCRCRVGFIVPSMHRGGAEQWTLSLAEHGDRSRITWSGCVVTQSWRDESLVAQLSQIMPVHQAGMTTFRESRQEGEVYEAVGALLAGSDVVVVWEVDEAIDGFIADAGIEVVHVSHRESPIPPGFVRPGQHLAGVSEGCRSSFGAERAETVKVIPNGIDLRRCHPIRSRGEVRELWQCSGETLVIGSIGRIDPAKNWNALARVVDAIGPDAIAVCYGPPGIEAEEVLSEVRAARGGDRVRVFPAVDDVGSVLHALDAFVLPSRTEAHSMALLEAWAAGVPVVATAVGALPELEAAFGPLAVPIGPDDSAELLAAAVARAAADTPEMHEMRHRARQMVAEHFRAEQMASAWSSYILELWEQGG